MAERGLARRRASAAPRSLRAIPARCGRRCRRGGGWRRAGRPCRAFPRASPSGRAEAASPPRRSGSPSDVGRAGAFEQQLDRVVVAALAGAPQEALDRRGRDRRPARRAHGRSARPPRACLRAARSGHWPAPCGHRRRGPTCASACVGQPAPQQHVDPRPMVRGQRVRPVDHELLFFRGLERKRGPAADRLGHRLLLGPGVPQAPWRTAACPVPVSGGWCQEKVEHGGGLASSGMVCSARSAAARARASRVGARESRASRRKSPFAGAQPVPFTMSRPTEPRGPAASSASSHWPDRA